MSRSNRTVKARRMRELGKAWSAAYKEDSSGINKIRDEMSNLLVDGSRYGNRRKDIAETKVIDRRRERKIRNRQPLEE
jgi:hypothetical protein